MALKNFIGWLTGDDSTESDERGSGTSPKTTLASVRPETMATPDAKADAFFAEAKDEMERLRRQYAKDIATLGSATPPLFGQAPKIDETPSSYTVTLDLAGFGEKDFKIEAQDKTLSISAEHRCDRDQNNNGRQVTAHISNRVRHVVKLSASVDPGTIASSYDGRNLRITAQKV